MPEIPVQRSDATPQQVGDPMLDAQAIVDDTSKKGSPEWMAAMQLLIDESKKRLDTPRFEELEREMQALRGMSEI